MALVQNNNTTLNVLISSNSNDEPSLPNYAIALIVTLVLSFVGLVVLVYKKCINRKIHLPNPPDLHIEIQNQPQNLN